MKWWKLLGSLFLFVFFLFLAPCSLKAQLEGTPITYLDSIVEDENEERLSFPSFVWAEPVKNEIYIIDARSRVMIYTLDLFPLFTLDKRDGIESPQGLTVDKEGNLYVAQGPSKSNKKPRISIFNACLKWEKDIYITGFDGADSFTPYRLATDKNGNIYVAGNYSPNVLVINQKGKLLYTISAKEEREGEKVDVKINGVVIDKDERIYLLSEEESHIYVYDKNREFLFKFGQKGGSTGKLSRPRGLSVDELNKRIYIVDYMRHTISVYNKAGKYLFEFGGLGWGAGWFQYPRDICIDPEGKIIIADTFNDRVQVFKTEKTAEEHFLLGEEYRKKGEISKAISEYRLAEKLEKKYGASLFIKKAQDLKEERKLKESAQMLEIALTLDPKEKKAYFYLGETYCLLEQFKKAISTLEKAIKLDSKNSYAHYYLGLCFFRLGQQNEAIDSFKKALTLNDDSKVHYDLALAYQSIGEYDLAMNHYKKAISMNPELAEKTKFIREASILDFINRWLKAWENKDFTAYASFYSPKFLTKGWDLKKWLDFKKFLFLSRNSIMIEISDLKVTKKGKLTIVCFQQAYQDDRHKDRGEKCLYLEDKERWQIIKEEWRPLPEEAK